MSSGHAAVRIAVLLFLAVTSACGADSSEPGSAVTPSVSASATVPTPDPTATTTSRLDSTGTPAPTPAARPLRGVDVSHHQGDIDWVAVGRGRISFAYLKATEGGTFTDPRFATHARAATRAGLRVGGYHYFTLCSPGAPQAEHFVRVLGSAPARTMPPAIDLELLGNCAAPPPRDELLREIRAFVDIVERRTHQRVVVYAYPDLESRYRLTGALDRRLWVRRIGNTPPEGDWWLWQRDDRARIDGIAAPADLNVMAP